MGFVSRYPFRYENFWLVHFFPDRLPRLPLLATANHIHRRSVSGEALIEGLNGSLRIAFTPVLSFRFILC